MPKYINAEQLIDIVTEYKDESFKKSSVYAISTLMPAADVVEIVRCKDCKHNVISHGRYCTFGDCTGCLVADDFFCKYGERKETDD